MRFALKCVITLAVLYRAILLAQGGAEPAVQLAQAVPGMQLRARDAIATRIADACRSAPATCLGEAARLTQLVSGQGNSVPATSRPRQGAAATASR